MKTCTKCGESKPLTAYAKSKTGKHGRRSQCKECMNRASRVQGWRGPSVRLPYRVKI